ncbi:MAG: adenylate/guanylate cyclase domain-containing protein [Bacteriovorax sp.]|nr:adenylate/guanylate cyclase domain-containing protein [Bacteriovorax sp.]
MKVTTNKTYNFIDSFDRIQEIIDSSSNFNQVSEIPNSDTLSYTNGYYLNCYSIFLDIMDSSKLSERYQKQTLAKIFRAYISEVVALLQSSNNCIDVNIVGNSVWAIYDSIKKEDVLHVFYAAYSANSLIRTLNYKLSQKGIDPIKVGIGIDKGDALMMLAGNVESRINDVVYMGSVINDASHLCSKACKNAINEIVISQAVYDDLSGYKNKLDNDFQKLFYQVESFYHGSIINSGMNNWLSDVKQKNVCSLQQHEINK